MEALQANRAVLVAPGTRPSVPQAWRTAAAMTITALVALAAAFVVARRFAGALENPPGLPALLTTGAAIAAATAAGRSLWRGAPPGRQGRWMAWATRISPSLAAVALAGTLSLSTTPPAGLVALWLLLIVEEGCTWWRGSPAAMFKATFKSTSPPETPAALLPPLVAAVSSEPGATHVLDDVVQQWTRCRAADGSDVVTGWMRADFASGQRTTAAHVAFCPPFAEMPQLSFEQHTGPRARIKLAQLYPYGARLDVKLVEAHDQAVTLLLRLTAKCSAAEPH